MIKTFISPSNYVQGPNVIKDLASYLEEFGGVAVMVATDEDRGRVQAQIDEGLANSNLKMVYAGFNTECTEGEAQRIVDILKKENASTVIGLGGGKAMDTAKAAGHYYDCKIVCVATIAATDAPCSHTAVLYTEDGSFDKYLPNKSNPDLVMVDTAVVAKAPTRLLVAGIGDALSTYFEARSCSRANADNNTNKGKATLTGMMIAETCYNAILEDSVKAIAASEMNVATPALDNIVEANTLLSGVGFESAGLAAAHAVHNGLTALEECHHYYHGEKVAFGTIVHLILENAPSEELDEVLSFCKTIGLPTSLADLGVQKIKEDDIRKVAALACAPGETIYNMPFEITEEMVYAAILTADKIGSEYQ